ncbi:cysteine desulfurase [Candidatus Bathyarchaeota archaeon]|nr:cysteine desulfurase [Candidatus Bathyarchaeota archaeon]
MSKSLDPETEGRSLVYLDNAETTRLDPAVLDFMKDFMVDKYGVPAGEFGYGLEEEAGEAIEQARERIARRINASPEEIIFTSGGTESNNIAILGAARSSYHKGKRIVTSKIEHTSVLRITDKLTTQGFEKVLLDVDREGFVNPANVKANLGDARLVSVQHGNQEIGTLQDVAAIGGIARESGVLFHCDAVQSFAREKLDVQAMKVDLLSMSSHLIHGPKGVGALYVRNGVKLEPVLYGDDREKGLRPGTPNVAGIVGFAKAAEFMTDQDTVRMRGLRDELIESLLAISDSRLNGPRGEGRLCNNVNISFRFVEGEAILMHLDLRGLVANTGSACYSQKLEPSHVIRAIGGTLEESHSSTRLSLSKWTTRQDVAYATETVKQVVETLRAHSPLARKASQRR